MSPTMVGRRKRFWVPEASKTADWRSKIGDKKFRSGFSSFFLKTIQKWTFTCAVNGRRLIIIMLTICVGNAGKVRS